MAIPTSYTEDDLAAYMLAVLDAVGVDLGLSTAPTAFSELGDFSEPINDVLLQYGTEDVESITGTPSITTLRAIAKVHAWKLARARASAFYKFSDGGQTLERQQVFDHINMMLAQSESDLAAMGVAGGGGSIVRVGTVRYTQDPYGPFDPSSGI